MAKLSDLLKKKEDSSAGNSVEKVKENSSVKSKVFQSGSYSLLASLIVIAIAVVVNLLIAQLPSSITKVDISSAQLLSLSDQTKEIVATVEDDIDMYVIAQTGTEDPVILEFLQRYAGLNDHLSVEQIDPIVNPNFASQYTDLDVSDNSIVVECGDRYLFLKPKDIYEYDYTLYNVTGNYEDIIGTFKGEAAVTGAISYVTSEDLPKVYLLTGHGEAVLSDSFSSALSQENFDMTELNLLTVEAIPDDCDALLINTPTNDITAAEKEMILSYLQAGGDMMLITNYSETSLPNFDTLMAEYGVSTVDGVIFEGDTMHCLYGYATYLLPDMNSHTITDPILAGGTSTVLAPVAEGIVINEDYLDTLTFTKLLVTSDSAFSRVDTSDMSNVEKMEGDIDGPFAVAIAITDTIDKENDVSSNIVWFSTGLMFDDTVNEMVSGTNMDVFLNSFGWMCDYESSITIHAKSLNEDYITVPKIAATIWSIVLVGVLPLVCLLAGLFVWIRRKRK